MLRLRPNQDIHKELDDYVRKNGIKAAFILTCVGSVSKAVLRMAHDAEKNSNDVKK
jgi:predicted DNA-binding protein with PD1-like motif